MIPIRISEALSLTSKCISVRINGEEETDMALTTMGDLLAPDALNLLPVKVGQPCFSSFSPYISESHTECELGTHAAFGRLR